MRWGRKALVATVAVCSFVTLFDQASADHDPYLMQHSSVGPAGGNGAFDPIDFYASRDGTRVWIRTKEPLVAEDTDTLLDLYERTAGGTSLLSTGPTDDGTATAWSFLGDASADGTHVYFESLDRLTPDATEGSSNLYERVGATTTLIPGNHQFAAVADDGSRVMVSSTAQLTPDDLDAAEDIYEWAAGTMTLISTGPQAGAANTFPATPIYTSPDGTRVFFETREALVAEDTDSSRDIYERSGGVTSLRSTGPQVAPVTFQAVRGDGDHVFFITDEALVAEDTDGCCRDVYENSNGMTSIVSDGPAPDAEFNARFAGASADGSRAFFTTLESLTADDTDSNNADVYERAGGLTTLIDVGTALAGFPGDGAVVAVSGDGERLVLQTSAQGLPSDTDAQSDLYEIEDGVMRLLSTGPSGGNGDEPDHDVGFAGASADARRVFFRTTESLVPQDTDTRADIYESVQGATFLVSLGPTGGNGAFDTECCSAAVAEDGSSVHFQTAEQLTGSDTDSSHDVYRAVVPAGHVRPAGASPFRASLVPAYTECTTPNREHGPPLAYGSCAPPGPASPNLKVGVGDVGRSIGFVRLIVDAGVPGGADDTDVRIRFSLSNVMRTSDLSEYAGELRTSMDVRLTDRSPAATTELALDFDVPCVPTEPTTDDRKSLCEVTTTLDAVTPGAAAEASRAVWALDQVKVYDGGPDEDAGTATDNSLFAVQGLFIP